MGGGCELGVDRVALEETGAEKYEEMEPCNLGGNLFKLAHLTSSFTTNFSCLDLPANAWSFIVETTK